MNSPAALPPSLLAREFNHFVAQEF